MNKPFFSIIIPTYNRANFVGKTIQSILNQTFRDFELIVIDDGSTDNTKEVIEGFMDSKIRYFLKKNEERAIARNLGIIKANGEYITFLDSDDLLKSNHLFEAKKYIDKNRPSIFHQAYEIKNNDRSKSIFLSTSVKKSLVKGNPLSCMGVFIKRDIAKENLFHSDPDIIGSEDYELWLRLASKYKFEYNPIVSSTLTIHSDRSVFNMDCKKLYKRKIKMLDIALSDLDVKEYYYNYRNEMYANAYSYIALHAALMKGNRWNSVYYLYKSFLKYPLSIIQKRTLAIIKHLIF